MQSLRVIERTAQEWGVQLPLPRLLRAPGPERLPRQAPRRRDARGNPAVSWEPWPGARAGVRKPDPGETPLSLDEVRIARKLKLLENPDEVDDMPQRIIVCPPGTWERRTAPMLAKPSPWEGLLS